MKTYKTNPDKYGWRLRIHLLNDGCIRIWREKKGNNDTREIDIWEKEEISLLEFALRDRNELLKEVQGGGK
jgi:hypothetical protein